MTFFKSCTAVIGGMRAASATTQLFKQGGSAARAAMSTVVVQQRPITTTTATSVPFFASTWVASTAGAGAAARPWVSTVRLFSSSATTSAQTSAILSTPSVTTALIKGKGAEHIGSSSSSSISAGWLWHAGSAAAAGAAALALSETDGGAAAAAGDTSTEQPSKAKGKDKDGKSKSADNAQKAASKKWEDIKGESGLDGLAHKIGVVVGERTTELLDTGVPSQITAGFTAGFCMGYAVKKSLKVFALVIGFIIMSVQLLAAAGYVSTSWDGASGDFVSWLDANGDGKIDSEDFKIWFSKASAVVGYNLPAGSGWLAGWIMGLKNG